MGIHIVEKAKEKIVEIKDNRSCTNCSCGRVEQHVPEIKAEVEKAIEDNNLEYEIVGGDA